MSALAMPVLVQDAASWKMRRVRMSSRPNTLPAPARQDLAERVLGSPPRTMKLQLRAATPQLRLR
eukprot:9057694-Alexandrium_andersonii.AAC.1